MDVFRTIENMICNDGDESDTEEQITDAPEKAFYSQDGKVMTAFKKS